MAQWCIPEYGHEEVLKTGPRHATQAQFARIIPSSKRFGALIELAEMITSIGEPEEANAFLQTMEATAASFCRAFLESDAEAAVLLRGVCDDAQEADSIRPQMPRFVDSLVTRRDARGAVAYSSHLGTDSDALSEREHEVLRMISGGFANKRIARALTISPETVKSHVKRIFLKLKVGTRAAAVCKAQSLGFL